MANTKSKQSKPKSGLARCMELASDRKGLIFSSAILSSLAAIASFIPYIAVYFMIRTIIGVYPNLGQLDMSAVLNYGWLALAGIVANILLYFLAIFSSHIAAFGTLYELKVLFADHITKIPLGYHLTIGSGRLRKIMDENIESVEGFIAHQFPDFVASVTAPIVMVIILFTVDWRFGLASLVGIILAFIAEFIGYGSGEMKENMGKYQTALEEMNNASVEYVRGMPVVKAFNQTASSFKKLKDAISGYTEWVLKFSLGWQNCMPAFTTNQRIIAENAQFTGIAAGQGVGFTTGLLHLRKGLGMRETPIRPHSWHCRMQSDYQYDGNRKRPPVWRRHRGSLRPRGRNLGRVEGMTGSCGSGCDPAIHARRLRVYHRPRRLRMASRISIFFAARRFEPLNSMG